MIQFTILPSSKIVQRISKILNQFPYQNMKLRNSKIIKLKSKSDDSIDIYD
jgi:hypothetical protein